MDVTQLVKDATDIFQPVMESAMVLAAHYAQACGRDVVLSEDVRYGLMFSARNVTGRHTGSLFPEVYEESQSDSGLESEGDEDDSDEGEDSDSWETVDSEADESATADSDEIWTRYEGTTDEQAMAMNRCADTWDDWEPSNPAERALKNAVARVDTTQL